MQRTALVVLLLVAVFASSAVLAGPLTEARVTKIVNVVKVVDPAAGDRSARLDDVIKDDLALTTGIKSRSELLFQDNTLTRLGPESYFSFKTGTREMSLEKGTLLLQVPKGIGGARIHTAAVTAAITGTTIMMEYVPNQTLKVLVLEGSLRLSNGRFGDSLLLTPGRMVIMPPNAKRIPDPVTVDLKKVVKTSSLVNMEGGKKGKHSNAAPDKLPSMGLIETEIQHQQTGKDAHHLIDTNLVIMGKGTNVVLASDDLMEELATRTDIAKIDVLSKVGPPVPGPTPDPGPSPVSTPNPTPNPAPTPNPNPPPSGTPPPPPPVTYITDNTTVIHTNNAAPKITTQGVDTSGVIYQNLTTNGSPAAFLFGSASVFDNKFDFDNFYLQNFQGSAVFSFNSLQLGSGLTFDFSNGSQNVTLVGLNGITNTPGSTVDLSGSNNLLFATQAGNITLDSGISFTSTTNKPNFLGFYARGGDLQIGSAFTLGQSNLEFVAENNAVFGPTAAITAKSLTVSGLQTVQFDGNANAASTFQLNGGSVELGGKVTTNAGFIYGSSATINGSLQGQNLLTNVTGDFALSNTGSLSSTGDTPGDMITAGGNLTLDGTVTGKKVSLTAGGALGIGGTINTNDVLTATAATATVNGAVNVKAADFETSGDFVLGNTGSLTTAGDGNLTINSTGGNITLDGNVNCGHNMILSAPGAVAIDHAITATQLDVTGASVSFGADLALSGSGNELIATNGNIDATGHQLTGWDQVTLTNGSFTAGGLSANNLTLNTSGTVNVANNLVLAKGLTTPGTVTVGGLLSAQTINAGDITTNGLHANSLTSSGVVSVGSSDFKAFSGGGLAMTAKSFVFGANVSLSGSNADLTTTNGGIDATGHLLSGFDQLSLTGGDFVAGGLSANNLMLNTPGTINVANNLVLTKAFTAPGAVTVGGLLSAPSVTGGDITANALHTNSLTSTGVFTLGSSDLAPMSNTNVTITAPTVSLLGGANLNGANGTSATGPKNGSNLTINTGTFALNSALNMNGGDGHTGPPTPQGGPNPANGADGGQLNVTSSDSITLNAPISATTGQNTGTNTNGGNGGMVNLTATNGITLNDHITVSSNSGKRRSAKGGTINVTSNKTSGTAIAVNSSAQLLALLNSTGPGGGGGSIKFVSAGGDINVNGATMQADKGTIDIRNNGTSGLVALNNATLNASTIKVGALGNNGTLTVGGGTISADTIIKLYAGGSNGTVAFIDNVTLGGNSVKTIAGDTVTIFNGKVVTVNGPTAANVFTNHPNYTGFGGNGSTTGTWAGKGATTQPLASAPGF